MSLSTENIRRSVTFVLPVPDGTIDKQDRMQVTGLYSGLALPTNIYLTGAYSSNINASAVMSWGALELLVATISSGISGQASATAVRRFSGETSTQLSANAAGIIKRRFSGTINAETIAAAILGYGITEYLTAGISSEISVQVSGLARRLLSATTESELLAIAGSSMRVGISGELSSVLVIRAEHETDALNGAIAGY